MIFYKNLKKNKKSQEKDLTFSIFANGLVSNQDDLISKPAECKSFFNFSFEDGSLKTGIGFKDLEVPATEQDIETCHTFNFAEKVDQINSLMVDRWYKSETGEYVYMLLFTDGNYQVWGVPLIDPYGGFVWVYATSLKSKPTFSCPYRINNVDSTIFFSNDGMLYLSNQINGLFVDFPALISCVVHYDKFFGITNTNRNTLIYTSNLDLTQWSEEENSTVQFLDNRGAFKKLVAFNDYVYLFRENGITKISIYTSKNTFSFTHLYCSTSKIYENSVCVCGDKIYFMTRDGLYTFNGSSVDKIMKNYDEFFKKLDNANCACASFNGKYYLATKCNFDDGQKVGCESESFVNNALFEIDIETQHLNMLRGVDICSLVTVDNPFMGKLCACFNGQNKQRIGELVYSGELFEQSTLKEWKSFSTDLGYRGKQKHLKEIVLNTRYDCKVEIVSEKETKVFSFVGSEKEQRMRINMYGKIFQFKFQTETKNCKISKPMVVFDVVV